jgi:hypothetical protein
MARLVIETTDDMKYKIREYCFKKRITMKELIENYLKTVLEQE